MTGGSSTLRLGAGLAAAVAAVSSAALFVLLAAPLPSGVIAALRVTVTALALAAVGWRGVGMLVRACRARPGLAWRIGLASALLAVHFASWIASLGMTSVVRSVALVSTQPLFAGLLGRAIGDRAPARLYAGACAAAIGAAIMASPAGATDAAAGPNAAVGDVLALAGAVAAAGYLVVGRSLKAIAPLPAYLAVVHAGAAALLATYCVVVGAAFDPPEAAASDYLAVVYLGLVPGVIGHGLFNWAVRHTPVHVVSLAALLEPVGAAMLAYLVLGSPVGAVEAAGAVVVLAGVAIGLPRVRCG
jgi:drug/metabolite transporter (DMT)-like permease